MSKSNLVNGILISAAFLLGGLVGLLVAITVVSGGPAVVGSVSLTAGLVLSALCAYYLQDELFADRRSFGAIFCIAVFIGAMAMPINTLYVGPQDARSHREMASKLQAFCLQHFNDVDSDRDGIITKSELKNAIKSSSFSEEDKQVLVFLLENLSEAGHIIQSQTAITETFIGNGQGGGFFAPGVSVTNVYGISVHDLEIYPDRVAEMYQNW